jgi:hypothetical protein
MSEEKKKKGLYEEWEDLERDIWIEWLNVSDEAEEDEAKEPVQVPESRLDTQS